MQVAAQKAKAKDGKAAKSKESKGKKQEVNAAVKRKGGAVAAERLKADIVATIARRKFASRHHGKRREKCWREKGGEVPPEGR